MVKFNMERPDIVSQIAHRAVRMQSKLGLPVKERRKYMDYAMDIAACNATIPLDLDKLSKADDATFAHDVFGIARHLDRQTGEMKDCFVPRCAKPTERI